ncbi:MAG: GntR family transcriptional regulator [Lachnospiraceae bacterium]|jgi:DNA-binding GntR family transcriptional regulator|nr:GntR family transcriptional regulator [Lachnospiraceae bacterium]SFT32091.1 DNA-binding transcriptional regulator, GntR family [Lachnospiraceae bacterium XBD2001]MBQ1472547.1 GntR family transcriptional regulator [Lachnospiraceae bacterium]MBQ1607438.1 GntR family transcriptional regulator [Lachnospiraceae bacterium]MBQ1639685.1 GntR family transcriptional regulator [Lachnospiraceae bacterium]
MNGELKLDMDAYLPLRDVVFNTLRDAILKGELEPGERLMEIHLAEKLGVSRTPIREAIRMLEQEGLAITVPRKGAQVAKMTEKDLEDVLEIRDALDELAAIGACKHMSPEILEELNKAMKSFEEAIAAGEVRRIVEADEAFHNVIYRASDNPKLEAIALNLKEQMYRYRYEYIKDNADYSRLIAEHNAITEGLKNGDREYVREVMHTHLENQVEGVKNVIRKQEESAQKKEEKGPRSWRTNPYV